MIESTTHEPTIHEPKSFNIHSNNCAHYALKLYREFHKKPFRFTVDDCEPASLISVQRILSKASIGSGLRKELKNGDLIVMKDREASVFHHVGFMQDDLIYAFDDETGYTVSTAQELIEIHQKTLRGLD